MKEIVLDTETTGLSVEDGHRIVEIGCIELEDLIPTKNNFHQYLNPERKVSEFDLSHLNNELKILGKKPINNKIVDTLVLARNKYPGSPSSLDALCKRYRIDNSKRKLHTALIDCDLLAKVYINLTDQKEPTLNFINKDEKLKEENYNKSSYFKKVVEITSKELNDHKVYLRNNLKKNYFS